MGVQGGLGGGLASAAAICQRSLKAGDTLSIKLRLMGDREFRFTLVIFQTKVDNVLSIMSELAVNHNLIGINCYRRFMCK